MAFLYNEGKKQTLCKYNRNKNMRTIIFRQDGEIITNPEKILQSVSKCAILFLTKHGKDD